MTKLIQHPPPSEPPARDPDSPRRYLLLSLLWTLLLAPLPLGFFCLVTAVFHVLIGPVLGSILTAVILRYRAGKTGALPREALWRYLPLLLPLFYYLLAFVVSFGLSGYRFDLLFEKVLTTLAAPWIAGNLVLAFMGEWSLFPLLMTAAYGSMFLVFLLWDLLRRPETRGLRRGAAILCACLLVGGVCAFQFQARAQHYLGRDYSTLRVENEVDLWPYDPANGKNILYTPPEEPSLLITENHPRLDGATALYPVYAAVAKTVYKGLEGEPEDDPEDGKGHGWNENSRWGEFVQCTKTTEAYARLIRGEVELIFVAQPSQAQLEDARAAGVELRLHPLGKEAFVFFVNRENPVSNLSRAEIQGIYQKLYTNWGELGGRDLPILPFQRPANSGSQTAMEAFMEGKALPKPLREEYAAGMGGIVDAVAEYRNYEGAVGYSFRFYATGMKKSESLKLLSVDGIAPTVENIADDSYPLTSQLYAVTAGEPEGQVRALLHWLASPQGQALIKGSGYVPLTPAGT